MIFEDKKFTYGELFELINKTANFLSKKGVQKGDRVCLYLPNCWEHVVCHFGVLRAGAVIVPFNVMYKPREINYMINDSGARTIITTSGLYPNVAAIRDAVNLRNVILIDSDARDDTAFASIYNEPEELIRDVSLNEREDLALIQYTSGTTGEPKGAMLTYHNIISNVRTVVNVNSMDDRDITLAVLPMFHSFGILPIYYSIYAGGTIVLVRRFDAELVLTYQPISSHPVQWGPDDADQLHQHSSPAAVQAHFTEALRIGGAVVPIEILDRFKKLTNATAIDGYGCTEAYGFITTPYGGVYRHGSIGIPMPHVEVRLVDDEDGEVPSGEVGEIVVRGPIVTVGYSA